MMIKLLFRTNHHVIDKLYSLPAHFNNWQVDSRQWW